MATLDGWSVVAVQSSHQQTGSDLQSMVTLSMTSASLNSSEQVAELEEVTIMHFANYVLCNHVFQA